MKRILDYNSTEAQVSILFVMQTGETNLTTDDSRKAMKLLLLLLIKVFGAIKKVRIPGTELKIKLEHFSISST